MPTSDEAHSTPHAAGPRVNENKQLDFKDCRFIAQAFDESPSVFQRLERQFSDIGLALYPLSGNTVLVSSPVFGMTRTLPDLRAAQIYLRQIGGKDVI